MRTAGAAIAPSTRVHTITHGLVGWVVASSDRTLTRRERALVAVAGVAPDLDGLGIVAQLATRHRTHPLLWFSDYHHVLAHNLGFALALAALAGALARHRTRTVALVLLSVHLHFLGDLVGSGGIDGEVWTIPYWRPFSARGELAWSGQWALDAWPNFVVTLAAIGGELATKVDGKPRLFNRQKAAMGLSIMRCAQRATQARV